MNTVAIKRIAWKEFRQQAVVFVALAVIAILVFWLTMLLFGNSSMRDRGRGPAIVIGMFAALYAAACGATLFATEKEERTFFNLQILPITPRQLIAGKLSVSVVMCLCFCLIMLLAIWLSGVMKSDPWLRGNWAWGIAWLETFGLGAIEFFLWSVFFSLLLSRPLVAAALGIAVASILFQVNAIVFNGSGNASSELLDWYYYFGVHNQSTEFWPRCLVAVTVLFVDCWLASRWLTGNPVLQGISAGKNRIRTRQPTTGSTPIDSIARPGRRIMFGRLLWQALRNSWTWMLVYLICLPLCIPFAVQAMRYEVALVLLLFIGGLAGVFAFSSDKTSSGAAFLAHHGERPGLYWLANVTVWIGWILLINLLLAGIALIAASWFAPQFFTTQGSFALGDLNQYSSSQLVSGMGGLFSMMLTAIYCSMGMVLCFAAGQLCSLLINRRILAAVAAVALCMPVVAWYILMLASETPLIWSVLPLFASFMIAGYVATRWWLGSRLNAVRVTTLLLSIGVVWAGIGFFAIQKRMHEIPTVRNNVAIYRTGSGEPNPEILEQVRQKFSKAFLAIDEVKEVESQRFDALKEGDSIPTPGSNSPPESTEQLIAAIQFAAEHIDDIRLAEPAFVGKLRDTEQTIPVLPPDINNANSFLTQQFEQSVSDYDSRAAWKYLRAMLLLKSIHGVVYAYDDGVYVSGERKRRFIWNPSESISRWLSIDGLDLDDVNEAVDLLQDGWLEPVSDFRRLERDYLITSAYLDTFFTKPPATFFPWEAERSKRLLDIWASWKVEWFRVAENDRNGEPYVAINQLWKNKTAMDGKPSFGKWVNNTILPVESMAETISMLQLESIRHEWRNSVNEYRHLRRLRVAEDSAVQLLRLAVVAWQLKHGSMPEDMEQLVGDVLDEIPLDASFKVGENEIRKPRYKLIPEQPGPGNRFIVPIRSTQFGWAESELQNARVPDVVNRTESPKE